MATFEENMLAVMVPSLHSYRTADFPIVYKVKRRLLIWVLRIAHVRLASRSPASSLTPLPFPHCLCMCTCAHTHMHTHTHTHTHTYTHTPGSDSLRLFILLRAHGLHSLRMGDNLVPVTSTWIREDHELPCEGNHRVPTSQSALLTAELHSSGDMPPLGKSKLIPPVLQIPRAF